MTYKLAQPRDKKAHVKDIDDTENAETTHDGTQNDTTNNTPYDNDTIKVTHHIMQLTQNDTL